MRSHYRNKDFDNKRIIHGAEGKHHPSNAVEKPGIVVYNVFMSESSAARRDLLPRPEPLPVREANRIISGKYLWLIPNSNCNRQAKACDICFASQLMTAAEKGGYAKADEDYLRKIQAVSKLPWKEIILTGGEPTLDPDILGSMLAVIDPKKNVRIVSNGDWILNSVNRERILQTLTNTKRPGYIRMDISAHDPIGIFKKKIEAVRGKITLGVQLRSDETSEYTEKLSYLKQHSEIILETHRALRLGKAIETEIQGQGSVPIKLSKLMDYSSRYSNVGAYLIRGPVGVRFITNHETPYIVQPTPADLAKPTDSAEDIVRKAIIYYGRDTQSDSIISPTTTIKYAKAAFISGTPVTFERTVFHYDRHAIGGLMEQYCAVIAARNGIKPDELKKQIAGVVARNIFERAKEGKLYDAPYSLGSAAQQLALKPASDLDTMTNIIANSLMGDEPREYGAKVKRSTDPYRLKDVVNYWLDDKDGTGYDTVLFKKQLAQVGLDIEHIKEQMQALVNRGSSTGVKILRKIGL